MNQHQHPNQPSVEEFLASMEPDDDTEAMEAWKANPGQLHVIPLDPMERVASALEQLVELYANPLQEIRGSDVRTVSYDDVSITEPVDYAASEERLQLALEQARDTEDKLREVHETLDRIEAALGKSTAKPALAAKAVIDSYKNPQVPESTGLSDEEGITGTEGLDHALETYPPGGLEPVKVEVGPANPDQVPGHTRTPHEQPGVYFCRECSSGAQDWVNWPFPAVASVPVLGEQAADAIFVPETATEPQQPAHDAPVEEWRAYARSKGFAGPDIDKANRSQIRTALGVAQPVKDGA